MKTIKKILQKVIKYRRSVNMIFADKVIVQEWILFGRFTVNKSFKTI